MATILTLTGLSGSGKTTMQNLLVERAGFLNVKQWTTRKPRGDFELDEYVFATRKQMLAKAVQGHFADLVEHDNALYAISSYGFERGENYVAVMNVDGLEQLEKWAKKNEHVLVSALLTIDKETSKKRMNDRGDEMANVMRRTHTESIKEHDFTFSVDASRSIEKCFASLLEKFHKHVVQ